MLFEATLLSLEVHAISFFSCLCFVDCDMVTSMLWTPRWLVDIWVSKLLGNFIIRGKLSTMKVFDKTNWTVKAGHFSSSRFTFLERSLLYS